VRHRIAVRAFGQEYNGGMKRSAAASLHSAAFALLLLGTSSLSLADDAAQPTSGMWDFLRAKYYGDQPIGLVDDRYMSLEAPTNTPDPASTPLTLRFADSTRIKRARVFIDNNPSPLVATLEFGDVPLTEIDMRVRIDRFTSVRVVAEKSDGGLEMRSTWVQASGGCSAPPSQAAGGGALGEIRLRPSEDATAVLVSIHHPNSSGFQIDPKTGDNIPPHYISHIRISAGGKALLDADTGISIAENPTLRIASDKGLSAPLAVDAVDSVTQAHFTASTQSASPRSAAVEIPPAANGAR
jgi:sulfur-oxidizing protein SoxY